VIEHFDPHRGGDGRWTFDFARELLARGHEVHVIAKDFSAAGRRLAVVAHELGKVRSRWEFAEAAEVTLQGLDLDVVHDMGSGWACDLFMSHDGSRIAQWEHKLRLLPPWLRPFKRLLYRFAPRYQEFRRLFTRQLAEPGPLVLALSQAIVRDYHRYHGVRPERIRLVYNGVDTQRYSPEHRSRHRDALRQELGVKPDEVVFLFVGHDTRRKGLATALRAVGRLAAERQPVRLVVVGGWRLDRYRRLARRCGAIDATVFVGPIEDSVPYYAAADAFVLPTFYDPCSLSVLEAAASALPSVTTRCNGAGELLTDGVHGLFLTDPADDRQLADHLRTLLDSALRQRMGEAARELALECTFERDCEQILEIYREIRCANRSSLSRRKNTSMLPHSGGSCSRDICR